VREQTKNINLRALLSGDADKVYWEISEEVVRKESKAPWYIGGHNKGDVSNWNYSVGNMDIDLIIEVNGTNCTKEETIKFDIVEQCDCPNVLSWMLYNADNDTFIRLLHKDDTVCLNETGDNINLRAVFSKPVDVVYFEQDEEIVRTEWEAPWFIGGDISNDIYSWNYTVGDQDIDVLTTVNGHNCTVEHNLKFTIMRECETPSYEAQS